MRLIVRPAGTPRKLGLLCGTFNPPTRAHLTLAQAALAVVDQVLLVLPGELPHKAWNGATKEQRVEMLRLITRSRHGMGAGEAEGGLFVEIAREAQCLYPGAEIYVVCGHDAAKRIVEWNYGSPNAIIEHLQQFRMLVAPRDGAYEPPPHVAHAVHSLSVQCMDYCASTNIRERVEGWRDLVPDEIAHLVEGIDFNS